MLHEPLRRSLAFAPVLAGLVLVSTTFADDDDLDALVATALADLSDDVRVYNRALSSTEIQAIAAGDG